MNPVSVFDHMNVLVVIAIASVPVYLLMGRLFFDDWRDFLNHLRFWFQPFWLSLLRGEYEVDMWAQAKLLLYVFVCAAWVYGLSTIMVRIFY